MSSPELLHGLLQACLASSGACLLVLLLRGPVRRRLSAGAAYGLWAMLPLAALAVLLPAPRTVVVAGAGAGQVETLLAMPVVPAAGSGWAAVLCTVWVIGAACSAFVLHWQQQRFVRALGPLQPLGDGCWQGADAPGLPALVGVLRPRIVLPARFHTDYSALEQALIVLHERTHLRRGDAWINAAVALWRCVFWFNPLFALAQRCLRADQEFSCDEAVIAQRGDARRSYASAMLKTSLALAPLPVGCHWQDIHPLKERIVMLKRPQQTLLQRRLAGFGATAAVVLVSTVAWAAQPARPAAPEGGPGKGRISAEFDAVAMEGAPPAGMPVSAPDPQAPAPVAVQARSMSAPLYPPQAFANNVSGKVVLEIEVGVDGKPTAIAVVESHPAGVFDASTVAAAWKWQFNPSIENGQPVAGKIRVPVQFDLDEELTQADQQPG